MLKSFLHLLLTVLWLNISLCLYNRKRGGVLIHPGNPGSAGGYSYGITAGATPGETSCIVVPFLIEGQHCQPESGMIPGTSFAFICPEESPSDKVWGSDPAVQYLSVSFVQCSSHWNTYMRMFAGRIRFCFCLYRLLLFYCLWFIIVFI